MTSSLRLHASGDLSKLVWSGKEHPTFLVVSRVLPDEYDVIVEGERAANAHAYAFASRAADHWQTATYRADRYLGLPAAGYEPAPKTDGGVAVWVCNQEGRWSVVRLTQCRVAQEEGSVQHPHCGWYLWTGLRARGELPPARGEASKVSS